MVPRDRDGSFDPAIVRKRQRRLTGIDEIVLSLTARGLTTRRGRRNALTSGAQTVRGAPDRVPHVGLEYFEHL